MIFNSRSPITIFTIVISMLFLVSLWAIGYATIENKRKNEALQFNERKWALNSPALYSYTVNSGCMWASSYKIEKNETGLLSKPIGKSPIRRPISVSDLFAVAKKANLTSHKVYVEYHPYFGFPTFIDVDWKKEVIDDECFIRVTAFEVLDRNET